MTEIRPMSRIEVALQGAAIRSEHVKQFFNRKCKVITGTPCFGAHVSTVDYGIPLPAISSFGYTSDAGIIRTEFENGQTRQRRRHTTQRKTYSLTWRLSTEWLHWWEQFAQHYGYKWHFLPLVTGQCADWFPLEHPIRYISDYSVELVGVDVWEVSVEAEQFKINYECFLSLFCEEVGECVTAPSWVSGRNFAVVYMDLDRKLMHMSMI